MRHISDVVKIEALSNYKIDTPEGEKNITVKKLACGN